MINCTVILPIKGTQRLICDRHAISVAPYCTYGSCLGQLNQVCFFFLTLNEKMGMKINNLGGMNFSSVYR